MIFEPSLHALFAFSYYMKLHILLHISFSVVLFFLFGAESGGGGGGGWGIWAGYPPGVARLPAAGRSVSAPTTRQEV